MSSGWTIEFSPRAGKTLRKLDRSATARILSTLERDLDRHGDPRAFGDALVGEWTGYWRYRIGDYRVIARIEDGPSRCT